MIADCPGCEADVDTTEVAEFAGLLVCPSCTAMFALR